MAPWPCWTNICGDVAMAMLYQYMVSHSQAGPVHRGNDHDRHMAMLDQEIVGQNHAGPVYDGPWPCWTSIWRVFAMLEVHTLRPWLWRAIIQGHGHAEPIYVWAHSHAWRINGG
jgi:hypothetical protein